MPRFAYTAGGFGLIDGDPKALRLPKIGRVHCMEDVAKRVGDGRVLPHDHFAACGPLVRFLDGRARRRLCYEESAEGRRGRRGFGR